MLNACISSPDISLNASRLLYMAQVAAMPRDLAGCYFRLEPYHGLLPSRVSAATGKPRVLLSGAAWGAAGPRSPGCVTACGFPPFWGEARFSQPLLDARCPFEVRPIGLRLSLDPMTSRSLNLGAGSPGCRPRVPSQDVYSPQAPIADRRCDAPPFEWVHILAARRGRCPPDTRPLPVCVADAKPVASNAEGVAHQRECESHRISRMLIASRLACRTT